MKIIKSTANGKRPCDVLRATLNEAGIKTALPSVKRGETNGNFWLFGEDAKLLKSLAGKSDTFLIEATNMEFTLKLTKNQSAVYCEFITNIKEE